jgi:hypothetical protein
MKVKVCGLPYMLLQKWTNLLFLQKNKVYTLTNFIMERTTTCIIKNKKKNLFQKGTYASVKTKRASKPTFICPWVPTTPKHLRPDFHRCYNFVATKKT